jgi:hypothetical protein
MTNDEIRMTNEDNLTHTGVGHSCFVIRHSPLAPVP